MTATPTVRGTCPKCMTEDVEHNGHAWECPYGPPRGERAGRAATVRLLDFFVGGVAVPQGSKVIVGGRDGKSRPRLIDSNAHALNRWRDAVSEAVRHYRGQGAMAKGDEVALIMETWFAFERPASVKRRYPTVKPDVDKLARAAGDAATKIAYDDDCRIVDFLAYKRYVGDPEIPHIDRAGLHFRLSAYVY